MSESLEAQLGSLNLNTHLGRVRTRHTTQRPSSGAGVAASGGSRHPKANGVDNSKNTQAHLPIQDNSHTNGGRVGKPKKKPKSKKSKKAAKKAAAKLSTGVNPDDLHSALLRALQEGAAPKFEVLPNAAMHEDSQPFSVKDFADLAPASIPHPSTPLSKPKRRRRSLCSQAQGLNILNNEDEHDWDVEMGDV